MLRSFFFADRASHERDAANRLIINIFNITRYIKIANYKFLRDNKDGVQTDNKPPFSEVQHIIYYDVVDNYNYNRRPH